MQECITITDALNQFYDFLTACDFTAECCHSPRCSQRTWGKQSNYSDKILKGTQIWIWNAFLKSDTPNFNICIFFFQDNIGWKTPVSSPCPIWFVNSVPSWVQIFKGITVICEMSFFFNLKNGKIPSGVESYCLFLLTLGTRFVFPRPPWWDPDHQQDERVIWKPGTETDKNKLSASDT